MQPSMRGADRTTVGLGNPASLIPDPITRWAGLRPDAPNSFAPGTLSLGPSLGPSLGVIVAGLFALGLAGCSAAEVATARRDLGGAVGAVAAACNDALAAARLAGTTVTGGAADTAASIAGYVTAGCATASAVATLTANSSSLQWLGEQQGALEALSASSATPGTGASTAGPSPAAPSPTAPAPPAISPSVPSSGSGASPTGTPQPSRA